MQYAKQTTIKHLPRRNSYGDVVDQEVVSKQQDVRPTLASRIRQIIYTIYSVIAALLLFRFAFALFGANPLNPVAHDIFSLTQPLVSPFQSLFGETAVIYKSSRFELGTLFAIAIYGFVAWIIARIVSIDRDAARHDETE